MTGLAVGQDQVQEQAPIETGLDVLDTENMINLQRIVQI